MACFFRPLEEGGTLCDSKLIKKIISLTALAKINSWLVVVSQLIPSEDKRKLKKKKCKLVHLNSDKAVLLLTLSVFSRHEPTHSSCRLGDTQP